MAISNQIWRYEVEVFCPGTLYRIPEEVEEYLSEWCIENTRLYWIRGSARLYWFQCEDDAVLFNMKFSR